MSTFLMIVVVAVLAFVARRVFRQQQASAENRRKAVDFFATNAKAEGVQVTPSGLQYQVLSESENVGTEHPHLSDTVKVHYHGTLLDGTVFDSSVDRGEPISFALNQVIRGWTEGLQLMVVGQKMRLFIPSDLAYGNRATGTIPASSALIFDVELLAINE